MSHWLNYLHQNKFSAMWNVGRKSIAAFGWFFKRKHMDKPIMQFQKIFSMWLFHSIKWAQHTFDINFWWFGCIGKTLGSNFSIKLSHIVSFKSSWDNDYCFVTFCKTEQFQKITNFFAQNNKSFDSRPVWVKIILWICYPSEIVSESILLKNQTSGVSCKINVPFLISLMATHPKKWLHLHLFISFISIVLIFLVCFSKYSRNEHRLY